MDTSALLALDIKFKLFLIAFANRLFLTVEEWGVAGREQVECGDVRTAAIDEPWVVVVEAVDDEDGDELMGNETPLGNTFD
jgi:hypothetical protein